MVGNTCKEIVADRGLGRFACCWINIKGKTFEWIWDFWNHQNNFGLTRMAKNRKKEILKLWSISKRFFLPSKFVQNLASFVLQITLTLFENYENIIFFPFCYIFSISCYISYIEQREWWICFRLTAILQIYKIFVLKHSTVKLRKNHVKIQLCLTQLQNEKNEKFVFSFKFLGVEHLKG